jgi:SAM-dependent methyltransferase
MNPQTKEMIIASYRASFQKYGDAPEGMQGSLEGQMFRFRKLMEIGDLHGRRVLDLCCAIGDLYPLLVKRFGQVDYTGVDLVPEMITHAAKKYPRARFLCRDLSTEAIDETFDYVMISGPFNNAIPDAEGYLRELLTLAFKYCTRGLAFNFISSHVNFIDREMAYHDPAQALDFCIRNLTRKVVLQHHYERVDVAIFAYR